MRDSHLTEKTLDFCACLYCMFCNPVDYVVMYISETKVHRLKVLFLRCLSIHNVVL